MQKKKRKKGKIIMLFLLLTIIMLTGLYFGKNYYDRTYIKATKTDEEQNVTTNYTFKLKNNVVKKVTKTEKYKEKAFATTQYEVYKIIKENENKQYDITQKGKKVILNMSYDEFKDHTKFNPRDSLIETQENGEILEVINRRELTEYLESMGFIIK